MYVRICIFFHTLCVYCKDEYCIDLFIYVGTYVATYTFRTILHMLVHSVHVRVYVCICIDTSQSQPTVCRNRDFKFVHCIRSSAPIFHLSPPPSPSSFTPPLLRSSSPPPLLSSNPLLPPYPPSLSSFPFPISLLPSLPLHLLSLLSHLHSLWRVRTGTNSHKEAYHKSTPHSQTWGRHVGGWTKWGTGHSPLSCHAPPQGTSSAEKDTHQTLLPGL